MDSSSLPLPYLFLSPRARDRKRMRRRRRERERLAPHFGIACLLLGANLVLLSFLRIASCRSVHAWIRSELSFTKSTTFEIKERLVASLSQLSCRRIQ